VEEGRVLANKLGIYLSTHFSNLRFSSQTDFSVHHGSSYKQCCGSESVICNPVLFFIPPDPGFGIDFFRIPDLSLATNFWVKNIRNTTYNYHRLDHICFDVFDYLIMSDCLCIKFYCFISFVSYNHRNEMPVLKFRNSFWTCWGTYTQETL
jgi:hypothetical protein